MQVDMDPGSIRDANIAFLREKIEYFQEETDKMFFAERERENAYTDAWVEAYTRVEHTLMDEFMYGSRETETVQKFVQGLEVSESEVDRLRSVANDRYGVELDDKDIPLFAALSGGIEAGWKNGDEYNERKLSLGYDPHKVFLAEKNKRVPEEEKEIRDERKKEASLFFVKSRAMLYKMAKTFATYLAYEDGMEFEVSSTTLREAETTVDPKLVNDGDMRSIFEYLVGDDTESRFVVGDYMIEKPSVLKQSKIHDEKVRGSSVMARDIVTSMKTLKGLADDTYAEEVSVFGAMKSNVIPILRVNKGVDANDMFLIGSVLTDKKAPGHFFVSKTDETYASVMGFVESNDYESDWKEGKLFKVLTSV